MVGALPQLFASRVPAGQLGRLRKQLEIGREERRLTICPRQLSVSSRPFLPAEAHAAAIECVTHAHPVPITDSNGVFDVGIDIMIKSKSAT
jgi:hypothetical protein